jgi:hypothetical protein
LTAQHSACIIMKVAREFDCRIGNEKKVGGRQKAASKGNSFAAYRLLPSALLNPQSEFRASAIE